VHEHDAVHELNAVFLTGVGHLAEIGQAQGARFFTKDMLARGGGAQDPLLSQAVGKRDINGINVLEAIKAS